MPSRSRRGSLHENKIRMCFPMALLSRGTLKRYTILLHLLRWLPTAGVVHSTKTTFIFFSGDAFMKRRIKRYTVLHCTFPDAFATADAAHFFSADAFKKRRIKKGTRYSPVVLSSKGPFTSKGTVRIMRHQKGTWYFTAPSPMPSHSRRG